MKWYEFATTILCTVVASNGLWAFITQWIDKRTGRDKLLMGLAYSEIINRAEQYIARGYITTDEYNELDHYLYEPYKKRGGNGTAARLMEKVKLLPTSKPDTGERKDT